MKKRTAVATLAGLVLVAATASAAVLYDFDPNTGTGWVGKGEVQTAFGWNNKAMQDRHTAITFEYDDVTVYSWQCEWFTGPDHNVKHHVQERQTTRGLEGNVAADSRRTGQYTGWFLTGFDGSGDASAVTPTCPGNEAGDGFSGEKVVVEGSFSAASGGGGLYAVYGSRREAL